MSDDNKQRYIAEILALRKSNSLLDGMLTHEKNKFDKVKKYVGTEKTIQAVILSLGQIPMSQLTTGEHDELKKQIGVLQTLLEQIS